MRLRMALYDIHITDWLRVFPRQQLLIIRTEEYRNNTAGVLRRVFKHLNIGKFMCQLISIIFKQA
jgi:N-acetylgalactosamine 4-sulfate 6-O-sulfotransferase